jgi:oxygen-independent coproporphyrinogen-3 oxidase
VPKHLYVHVPFCARRCSYCDFAIAVRRVVPVDEYLASLDAELAMRWNVGRDRWTLDTLYFGGGTPSRLGDAGVARMVDLVRARATLADDAEVTLEANPEDVSPASARAWRAAGVNRVSLGIQSFDDAALAWMHRVHDADRAERAVGELRAAGFDNFSVDLIFALPEAVGRSWERDVDRALRLEPPHVSLYGLTFEAHAPIGKQLARGDIVEAPEENYERDFLHAHTAMTSAGLEHYEVSNFGRAGFRSRHNSSYWTQAPYAAVGPGAHELDQGVRRWNVPAYSEWVSRLSAGEDPIGGSERLTADNIVAETVYLGLRTVGGLPLLEEERPLAAPWIGAGWATLTETGAAARSGDDRPILRLTALGWLRLDSIAAALTEVRSRSHI